MKEIKIYFISGSELFFSADDALYKDVLANIRSGASVYAIALDSKTLYIPVSSIERIEVQR